MSLEFRKLTIYGFGKWVDYTIDFAHNRLLCIYGENESGKSTLQEFILFILFGLPPKQRKFYRPKTSSQMGGSLTIFDANIGEVTIVRLDHVDNGRARCHTRNGKQYDERWLQKQLKGIDRRTYQSIFSFSAQDLVQITNMKEEDLGEALLGIGLSGSKHLYEIEKMLDTKIGELFKPYGKKPVMNEQIDVLNDLFTTLSTAKKEESHYRHKREKMIQLTDHIEQIQHQLRKKKEKVLFVQKQLQALPDVYAYRSYRKQLQQLPEDISFPEQGSERFQLLKDKLLPLRSELSVLQTNEQAYKKKKAKIKATLKQVTNRKEAHEILRKKQAYEELYNRVQERKQQLAKRYVQIDTELDELNLGLTRDDLAHVTFPFHLEKTWNELKNELERLALEYNHLQHEQQSLIRNKKHLEDTYEEVTNRRLSPEQTKKLRRMIEQYEQQSLLGRLQATANEKQVQWANKKKQSVRKHNRLFIFSAIGGFAFWIVSHWLHSSLAFNIAILITIVGGLQWLWGRKMIRNMDEIITASPVESSVSPEWLREIEEAERLLTIDRNMMNEQSSMAEQLKSIDVQLLQAEEKERAWKQKNSRLQQQMNEYHDDYPFLQSVEVKYWPELYHVLNGLKKTYRDIETYEKELKHLEEKQRSYEKVVNTFVKEGDKDAKRSIPLQLEKIEAFVTEWEQLEEQVRQYDSLLLENQRYQQKIEQNIHTYEEEMNQLFQMVGVSTEDEFYKRKRQLEKRKQLRSECRAILNRFSRLFTSEQWQQLVEQTPKENELELEQRHYEKEIKRMENELDDYRQRKANLKADVAKLESSETYSQLMHQFQMEKDTFNQTAKEWAILKTAKEMLVETKRLYRDKYLQRVIEMTTKYFNILTDGAYVQVHPPSEKKPFLVTAHNNLQYTIHELSQGTIDQLYISLRMAVSEVMSAENRLPFIIDDGFINFDHIRMKRMIEIVTEVSDHQQVILFTCKKEIVKHIHPAKVLNLHESFEPAYGE